MVITLYCYKSCVIGENKYFPGDKVNTYLEINGYFYFPDSNGVYRYECSVYGVQNCFCTEEDRDKHFKDVSDVRIYTNDGKFLFKLSEATAINT